MNYGPCPPASTFAIFFNAMFMSTGVELQKDRETQIGSHVFFYQFANGDFFCSILYTSESTHVMFLTDSTDVKLGPIRIIFFTI